MLVGFSHEKVGIAVSDYLHAKYGDGVAFERARTRAPETPMLVSRLIPTAALAFTMAAGVSPVPGVRYPQS